MKPVAPFASRVVPAGVLAMALAAVAVACGGDAPAPRTGADAADSGAPVRGVVPLSFEAGRANTKFTFAFVDGKVGDHPTRFIIDTGAAVHVIDGALATAANVAAPANATSLSINGWGVLPAHAVAVKELPASIRAHGIGGIISPQLLAENGQAIEVDLLNQKMRLLPKSTAWSALGDLGALLTPAPTQKLCPATTEEITGVALAVDGTVDGETMHLTVDTGASRSLLVESSKGGARALAHPVLGRSISLSASSETTTAIYGGVPFTFGAWSSTVDVGVMTPQRQLHCGAEGRLGMDVLRDCAIAMTADELLVACHRP